MPDRKLTLADVLAALPPEAKAKVDEQVADMKALATEAGIAGTCNKCRYWKSIDASFMRTHNIPDDWKECTLQEVWGAPVPIQLIAEDDGHDTYATMMTAPTHGCLQSRLPDKPSKE